MRTSRLLLAVSTAALQTGNAGVTEALNVGGDASLVPTLDARLRYEFADVQGFDDSHALTLRARVGLKTAEWNGFSAMVEGEFTGALVDDYHGGAPGVNPFDPANSLVADPENAELNRAFLQYRGHGATVIVGRQRIIRGNSAFIGNVGWRQNEQTYDAASLAYEAECGAKLEYAWIGRVNRIFGVQADGAFRDTESNVHLLNASFSMDDSLSIGGYAYLMEFDEAALRGWDNNTFGVMADKALCGLDTHMEFAYQEKAGPANNLEALYFHVSVAKPLGSNVVKLGVEQLDNGFQTPLATLHIVNGFADTTDPLRAAGTTGGLTDTYLSLETALPWEMKWTNVAHFFGDNGVGTSFGFGWDSMLVKKLNEHFSATAKLGYFDSNDARYLSATRASFQIDCSF